MTHINQILPIEAFIQHLSKTSNGGIGIAADHVRKLLKAYNAEIEARDLTYAHRSLMLPPEQKYVPVFIRISKLVKHSSKRSTRRNMWHYHANPNCLYLMNPKKRERVYAIDYLGFMETKWKKKDTWEKFCPTCRKDILAYILKSTCSCCKADVRFEECDCAHQLCEKCAPK